MLTAQRDLPAEQVEQVARAKTRALHFSIAAMDRALANPVNEAETEEMVVLEAQRVTVGRLSSSLSPLIK